MDFGHGTGVYSHAFNIENAPMDPRVLADLHNTLQLQLQPQLNASRPVPPMEGHPCMTLPAMPVSACSQPYLSYSESSAVPSPRVAVPLSHPATKKRKGQAGEVPQKRTRAKKPPDAPTRPKSAYMFFLAEFREQWKSTNPESKKVADMAVAAGEAWRSLHPERKQVYESMSTQAKAQYAVNIEQYQKDHPRPSRYEKVRDPAELKRPQSAYFFFLAEFREHFKAHNPGQAMIVKEMSKLAGEQWKSMSAEMRRPYEDKSTTSKQEYALLKTLSPEQRVAFATHGPAALTGRYPMYGMVGQYMQAAPPASSSPLGVVPDALHDQHMHLEDSPCYQSYNHGFNSDLTVPQHPPDIKTEAGYNFNHIHVAQQERMHPDALRMVLQREMREFKPLQSSFGHDVQLWPRSGNWPVGN